MKKLILSSILAAGLFAGEFQFGSGTFKIKGGFAGLNSEISTDVKTFSLVEQHKNVFSSKWFYKYNVTWISSEDMTQTQDEVNSFLSGLNLPGVNYKIRGLDANLIFGRDLINKDEGDTYLGAGVLLGISLPYVKSDNSSSDSNDVTAVLKDTDTEFKTYKLGINISASKRLLKKVSFYVSTSYAYQHVNIKNDDINLDTSSHGTFQEYEAGLKFTPFNAKTKFWIITLNPKIYFTLGYKYSYWKVKDVSINVTGVNAEFDNSDMNMKSSVVYIGAGYSF